MSSSPSARKAPRLRALSRGVSWEHGYTQPSHRLATNPALLGLEEYSCGGAMEMIFSRATTTMFVTLIADCENPPVSAPEAIAVPWPRSQ